MRTKNAKAITQAEHEHIGWVKEQPCAVCDAPGPSDAHHIEQGMHFLVVPLCRDCHTGTNGIHGTKALWKIRKMTELSALNRTIGRLSDGQCGQSSRGEVWPPRCR